MATQFVKWWKTKFQASTSCGYKNISVLGSDASDGRPSDTEDLVRDDASCSYHGGPHINGGLASSSASENTDFSQNEVKFEDFECDVQVEGSESGEERKEFSFTFYDLDGHGKITKDDIAGLVRSIYGAVNESITVPQGGKKTIKVKLTVTPEKPTNSSLNTNNNNNNINHNNNICNELNNNFGMGGNGSTPDKLRNNVNVTIEEKARRHRKDLRFSSVRIPNTCCHNNHRNISPGLRDPTASPLRNRKKWRERGGSLHRPDLFELIQASMEKNNVTPCCRLSSDAHQLHACPQKHHVECKEKMCRRHSNHHHTRSRSHDLSQNLFRYHLLDPCDEAHRKNNTEASPHQLKHRNREQEHARAMAQVISWLERENIGDKLTSPPHRKQAHESPPKKHHHVHEHIHHHYHHYNSKETPIIV